MAAENDELEKAISNRLATLATAPWPFDGLPLKIEPTAEQAYQTFDWLPFDNERFAIGDGASTLLAGIVQVSFFQPFRDSAADLTKRVDTVKNGFWANRRSIDAPAGPFIVRFPQMPKRERGPESGTHRTASLSVYYRMRSSAP